MRRGVRRGHGRCGGVLGYPLRALYREVAFIAYHFHWSHEAILELEHGERRRWVEEISAMNQQMNEERTG